MRCLNAEHHRRTTSDAPGAEHVYFTNFREESFVVSALLRSKCPQPVHAVMDRHLKPATDPTPHGMNLRGLQSPNWQIRPPAPPVPHDALVSTARSFCACHASVVPRPEDADATVHRKHHNTGVAQRGTSGQGGCAYLSPHSPLQSISPSRMAWAERTASCLQQHQRLCADGRVDSLTLQPAGRASVFARQGSLMSTPRRRASAMSSWRSRPCRSAAARSCSYDAGRATPTCTPGHAKLSPWHHPRAGGGRTPCGVLQHACVLRGAHTSSCYDTLSFVLPRSTPPAV